MPRETTIETLMYGELERRGITFVKQSVIDGLWVVDALIPGPKVVIECDGEYWHRKPEMERRDARRDSYLRSGTLFYAFRKARSEPMLDNVWRK